MTISDQEFIRSVIFFYEDRGDVTRYHGWDEQRCASLMPAFYKAWKDAQVASDVLRRVATTYESTC